MKPPDASYPVLLFDGECGLCNRVVRALLRLDSRARLRFAPLQGPAAQGFLRAHSLPVGNFDSFVYVPDWKGDVSEDFLLRTDALIAVLRACGGPARILAAALRLVPAAVRNAAYRLVARWRYRLFGAWRPRPLPHAEWAARFLDQSSVCR